MPFFLFFKILKALCNKCSLFLFAVKIYDLFSSTHTYIIKKKINKNHLFGVIHTFK